MLASTVWVIARKDIKDLLSGKFYVYVILLCLICLPYFDGISSTLEDLSNRGASLDEVRAACQSFVNVVAYTLPMVLALLMCSVFAGYSVVADKNKRILESLLATPAGLKQIWVGKSLAVALPALVVGVLVSLVVGLSISLGFVAPAVHSFVVPAVLPTITALITVPVVAVLLTSLVTILQLMMTNPRIPSLIFSVVLIAIYTGTVTVFSAGWNFGLIYLGFGALLLLAIFICSNLATKERVVLSSKA